MPKPKQEYIMLWIWAYVTRYPNTTLAALCGSGRYPRAEIGQAARSMLKTGYLEGTWYGPRELMLRAVEPFVVEDAQEQ